MEKNIDRVYAFRLGEFAAQLFLQGIIQSDFQLSNVGMRDNGDFTFCDLADVIWINMPENFNKENIRIMTESLLSLVDDLSGGIHRLSFLRAGMIAKSGLLGHMIYLNARENGFSSFLFCEKALRNERHSFMPLLKGEDVKEIIADWKTVDISLIMKQYGNKPEKYNTCKVRRESSSINKYYLDNTYLIYNAFDAILKDDQEKLRIVEFQLANAALAFGLPYTAYGLGQRCFVDERLSGMCNQIFRRTESYIQKYRLIADKHQGDELFEYLWLLEDLDCTLD